MAITTVDELKIYFYEKLKETGSLDKAFMKATWSAFRIGYNLGIEDGLMGNNNKFEFNRTTDKGLDTQA